MTTDMPALHCHLRPFAARDIAPWTAILNQVFADEPTTVEQQEHGERTYPAGNPRLRLVAETEEGQMGYGECHFRSGRPTDPTASSSPSTRPGSVAA